MPKIQLSKALWAHFLQSQTWKLLFLEPSSAQEIAMALHGHCNKVYMWGQNSDQWPFLSNLQLFPVYLLPTWVLHPSPSHSSGLWPPGVFTVFIAYLSIFVTIYLHFRCSCTAVSYVFSNNLQIFPLGLPWCLIDNSTTTGANTSSLYWIVSKVWMCFFSQTSIYWHLLHEPSKSWHWYYPVTPKTNYRCQVPDKHKAIQFPPISNNSRLNQNPEGNQDNSPKFIIMGLVYMVKTHHGI